MSGRKSFSRRELLGSLAAGLAGAAGIRSAAAAQDMPYRTLGATGEKVSLVGLGGFHIGGQPDENESIRIIRTAIDGGVNFMDNSWDYHNGQSELRMGKALRDGYRQKVFLMTKVDGRTRQAAAAQIDESLRRLQTNHVDLLQFHEVIRFEDPDRFFAPGGALEAFLDARKAGKLRYIGFTGHKDPNIHLYMLKLAREHNFRFDAVQMPVNVMDAHFRSFIYLVLPELARQNIGALAMKSLGAGVILKSKTATPMECLHFAMTQPVSVVITGIDSEPILNQAVEAARTFQPMDQAQMTALLNKTAQAAMDGRYEPFKTTTYFDSTAHHPEWMGGETEETRRLLS
jgi:predicted aldo/keto reductase-like oxidoreductase